MHQIAKTFLEAPADNIFRNAVTALLNALCYTLDSLFGTLQAEKQQMHFIADRLSTFHQLYV